MAERKLRKTLFLLSELSRNKNLCYEVRKSISWFQNGTIRTQICIHFDIARTAM